MSAKPPPGTPAPSWPGGSRGTRGPTRRLSRPPAPPFPEPPADPDPDPRIITPR
ncbi:hypothetical protein [Kitasatospora sp. McL0602]|uniref:hypothetical protein n=1 Tax=Kitasatospora sp. McL0602 TaxID=3439530 RepID=UPI003F8AAD1E